MCCCALWYFCLSLHIGFYTIYFLHRVYSYASIGMSPMYLSSKCKSFGRFIVYLFLINITTDIVRIFVLIHSLKDAYLSIQNICCTIDRCYRFLVKMNTFNILNEREQLGLNALCIQITLALNQCFSFYTSFRKSQCQMLLRLVLVWNWSGEKSIVHKRVSIGSEAEMLK